MPHFLKWLPDLRVEAAKTRPRPAAAEAPRAPVASAGHDR
jgi:hypothetical protein